MINNATEFKIMKGKTIRVYLVDGAPTGILTAEIINWTGKAIVASRAQLADLAKRDEAKRTGIYCLVGPDPDAAGKDRIYIGEGDSVLARLTSHDADEEKDFWTRAVMVISKDANLTKAHVRYLESRLIQLATSSGKASIANGNAPSPPPLPEPDVADMEYFLEQVLLIFPVLGFGFLQPKPAIAVDLDGRGSPMFTLSVKGASAKAQEVDGSFVIMQGSTACKHPVASWQSYKSLRQDLLDQGKLADGDNPDYYVFTENVPFDSPSAAAATVNAGNASGPKMWKVADTGQTYREWFDQKLKNAGVESDED